MQRAKESAADIMRQKQAAGKKKRHPCPSPFRPVHLSQPPSTSFTSSPAFAACLFV